MSGFRPGSARVRRLGGDGEPAGEPMAVDAVEWTMSEVAYASAAAGEEARFDPYDAEVQALMVDRAARQGAQLGSTRPDDVGLLVDAEPPTQGRRATRSVAEMRQRTREHYDPFGLDDHEGVSSDGAIFWCWVADGQPLTEVVDRLAAYFQIVVE